MLTGMLLGVLVVLRAFPETATAHWLERQIGAVRQRLARLERRHLVFAVLMTVIVIAGAELLAMAGPLDVGLVVLWDVSTYLDIVLAAGTVAAVARGRAGITLVASRLRRVLPRRRSGRTRPTARITARSANDDERPRALAA